MAHGKPGKYAPLVAYLAAQPAAMHEVVVPLDAIAQLVGEPLSPSVWTTSFWYGGREARRYWQAQGWAARLDRRARTVVFTRRA